MSESSDFVTLSAGDTSLVLNCAVGARPGLLYWGPKLDKSDPELLQRMTTRQHAPGSADVEVEPSLLNETGSGMSGPSGFSAHRNGRDWASLFCVKHVRRSGSHLVAIVCEDETTKVRATHLISLDPESEVMTCETEIENLGDRDLAIDWCTRLHHA